MPGLAQATLVGANAVEDINCKYLVLRLPVRRTEGWQFVDQFLVST